MPFKAEKPPTACAKDAPPPGSATRRAGARARGRAGGSAQDSARSASARAGPTRLSNCWKFIGSHVLPPSLLICFFPLEYVRILMLPLSSFGGGGSSGAGGSGTGSGSGAGGSGTGSGSGAAVAGSGSGAGGSGSGAAVGSAIPWSMRTPPPAPVHFGQQAFAPQVAVSPTRQVGLKHRTGWTPGPLQVEGALGHCSTTMPLEL